MFEERQIVYGDTYQPFARRSVNSIIAVVFAILGIGFLIGWWFYPTAEIKREQRVEATPQGEMINLQDVQMPGNVYEEDTGRGAVYDFFYKMFGGIEAGVEDAHINDVLQNNAQKANKDLMGQGVEGGSGNVSGSVKIKEIAEKQAALLNKMNDDEYNNSVYDAIGSEVYDNSGEEAGEIYDILIHKETGEASGIIVNQDDQYFSNDLSVLNFENVLQQENDGDVIVRTTEENIENKAGFTYDKLNTQDYVSLRNLQDGQLLDFEGNVLGDVNAVIYDNAEAQYIYFTLKNSLAPSPTRHIVGVPFKGLNIVLNNDGFDVQLTAEQTKELSLGIIKEKQKVSPQ